MSDMSAKDTHGQEGSRRRGWAHSASEDALPLTAAAFARAGFTDMTLVLRWAEIVGAEVARVARPVKLQNDREGAILTLKCEPGSTVLIQHETRRLIQRLNAYLGSNRIARLKLVAGELAGDLDLPKNPRAGRGEPPAEPLSGPPLSQALERLRRRRKP
jgi:hypothetical protein